MFPGVMCKGLGGGVTSVPTLPWEALMLGSQGQVWGRGKVPESVGVCGVSKQKGRGSPREAGRQERAEASTWHLGDGGSDIS